MDTAPLVVVLTWHTEPSYAARAIAAGAHGYVNKAVEPDELLAAIRAVSRGEQVIPAGVEELLRTGDGHPASALTAREQQVMEMLARGLTNREIAEHLEISIKTVDTHRGHVLKKLGPKQFRHGTRSRLPRRSGRADFTGSPGAAPAAQRGGTPAGCKSAEPPLYAGVLPPRQLGRGLASTPRRLHPAAGCRA
jgi:DNA-binding NarL/FixJ family response regulator